MGKKSDAGDFDTPSGSRQKPTFVTGNAPAEQSGVFSNILSRMGLGSSSTVITREQPTVLRGDSTSFIAPGRAKAVRAGKSSKPAASKSPSKTKARCSCGDIACPHCQEPGSPTVTEATPNHRLSVAQPVEPEDFKDKVLSRTELEKAYAYDPSGKEAPSEAAASEISGYNAQSGAEGSEVASKSDGPPAPGKDEQAQVNPAETSQEAERKGERDDGVVDKSKNASHRVERFQKAMEADVIELDSLRALAWSGVPPEYRARVWRLLLGYLPMNKQRRADTLKRKRAEYREFLPRYWGKVLKTGETQLTEKTEYENTIYRQIDVDIPRTSPDEPLFQHPRIQQALARLLYIWAIRHPASGYVQGINDLATPFIVVFLNEHMPEGKEVMDPSSMDSVNDLDLMNVEADAFWCMSKLLDGIQDHYTFAQPGIQRMVFRLKELVHRIDTPLYDHLDNEGLQFLQFAFRWMNCLLMREVSLQLIIRLWDTYLAEGESMAQFHVYVCASFLVTFGKDLMAMEFQDLVMFLQNLPTKSWGNKDIELLLSQAYIWKTLFDRSPNHLQQ